MAGEMVPTTATTSAPAGAPTESWFSSASAAAHWHPDGMITVGADCIIDLVNERAVQICGIPADELRGRPLHEALPLQDAHGVSWWDIADPWSPDQVQQGHGEQVLMLPNGRFVLLTGRFLTEDDGSIKGVIYGLRDADARMRAERNMADLISTVAHELRSPIASITGFTGSLLRHWDRFADEDKHLMLRTIQADAERVTRLITNLLDVSRIDTHQLLIRPRRADLGRILRAQVARAVARGADPDRFSVEVPDGLPELWTDLDLLEQIITNLVDNALRHGAGQVSLDVAEDVLGDAPAVRICVADEGDGIPEEHRELVFSRYWQGGSKAGTGIGLFLVRGFVEAHGGVVRLGAQEDGGTRVEVVLPAGEPEHLKG